MEQKKPEENHPPNSRGTNNKTLSSKSSDISIENNSRKNILEKKSINEIYETYKRGLDISNFTMKRAIKSVGKWIMNVENNRNLQMRSDFDEEKEYKLEKQREIQSHIEELSNYYEGENKITYFNEKIRQHKELYLKYTEMKENIEAKIRALKDIIPDLEKKIFLYKIQLRNINKENLKLMGQINHFENEISNKLEEDLENIYYNIDNRLNDSTSLNNSSLIGNSINVQEILEKNENLKKKKEKIDELKEILKEKKNENDYLIKNINMLNNNYFRCRKIYREGMYEIAKELLRINEIELDKVINNSNTNFNSLYFDIFKTNYNNGKTNKDFLKIPIINSNIKTKFKYPVAEKAQPNDLLYKVVKNIINENNVANKINNIKKNKFSWDEFKDFSAYQVYTLLNLNKKI
jgi:chromosome segregation ATPase